MKSYFLSTDGQKREKRLYCNAIGIHLTVLRFLTAVLKSNFVMWFIVSTETVHNHSEQSRLRLLLTVLTFSWMRKTALVLLPRPNAPTILLV